MTCCRHLLQSCVSLVAACLLAPQVSFAAGPDLPEIVGVQVGFAGKYRVGHWAPAAVTLRGSAGATRGRIDVTALDGDGVPARITWNNEPPVTVAAGGETVVHTIIKMGRLRGPLIVRFVNEEGEVASRTFASRDLPPAMPASQRLIVALGDELGIAKRMRAYQRDPLEATVVGHVTDARELPDTWLGYAGVDTVTLTTATSDVCRQMTDRQIAALHEWVLLGGRLILSAGSRGSELFGDEGRWSRFLPGRFESVSTLRETTGIEATAKAGRLDQAVGGRRPEVAVTVLADIDGRIDIHEGTLRPGWPVVIRAAHGLGQVVFVGVDLDTPPLAQWEGRPQLMDLLLSAATRSRDIDPEEQGGNRAKHVGYRDLSGQLRASLDRFEGVRVIPFRAIAALIVLYIALVGPIDYFLLRRFSRRMELTWLTFSLTALLFCVMAWWLVRFSRGTELRLNELAVIDVDVEQDIVRGTVWSHVFTPRAEAFDLAMQIDPTTGVLTTGATTGQGRGGRTQGEVLSWIGLPGTALGGMGTATRTDLLAKTYGLRSIAESDDVVKMEISEMPISGGASRSLVGRWWNRGDFPSSSTLNTDKVGMLRGDIVNPLPVDLTECVLLFDRWAYPIPPLAAGQTATIGPSTDPRNLETFLQQRRLKGMEDVTPNWDKASTHVPRIAQMLLFHEAAGGRAYTGLLHRYQGHVDLSDHLKLGRAVLVGRNAQPAVRLTLNGEPPADDARNRHWTIYRIVYPVELNAREL